MKEGGGGRGERISRSMGQGRKRSTEQGEAETPTKYLRDGDSIASRGGIGHSGGVGER